MQMKPSINILPPYRQSGGFTLTELLVVLVIVAILVAFILPLVNTMSSASKTATCISNLRTLGMALHAYISENNGRFPPSRARHGNDGNGNPGGQHHWIYSHYYGRMPTSSSEGLRPILYFSGTEPSPTQMTGKRHKDAGVFWCPADDERPVQFAASSYADNAFYIGGETAFSTHAVTGAPKNPNDYTPSHSLLAAVQRPSQIIYAIDHINPIHAMLQTPITHQSWPLAAGTTSNEAPGSNTTRVAFDRHKGKANALFLDGSVRPLTFEDLAGTVARYLNPALQQ